MTKLPNTMPQLLLFRLVDDPHELTIMHRAICHHLTAGVVKDGNVVHIVHVLLKG
jgi:hypothetical protein